MKLPRIPNIHLPLFFRVVGVYVLVGAIGWGGVSLFPEEQVSAVQLPQKTAIVLQASEVRAGMPSSISLPRLGIELAVIDGAYDKPTNSWTLTDDKTQFAAMTALPNNETGNTFIYGHNTAAVFAPLVQLQAGDEAIVRTTNGLSFHYRFNGNQIVNPDATSILAPTDAPTLTLMTCEGIFSEARRVAQFNFEKVI